MEKSAHRPGIIGVSKQWLERHNYLQEQIVKLKVKQHDIDQQIADLELRNPQNEGPR
jgi:hypothetical protein